MQELELDYKERLKAVAEIIQSSDELSAYLEEETPELYKVLQDTYEPLLAEIYNEVAELHPLQLLQAEKVMMNPFFEGLFLPRFLGYSVLRGDINEDIKYTRPQEHFKEVLIAIANSANFDAIKQRIGQTVQVGFALSSDIWIANLLDRIENKKVKLFLQSMKLDRFRDKQERINLLQRYKKQFTHYNFLTAKFPTTVSELKVETDTLVNFLLSRIAFKSKHNNYIQAIHELISRKEFYKEPEFLELLAIIANFITLNEAEETHLSKAFNDCRSENPQFVNQYFNFLKKNYKQDTKFGAAADQRVYQLLDKTKTDDLVKYYLLMDTIHNKGFVHEDALDATNGFYSQYEGMSINNEVLRLAILQQFKQVVEHLTEPEHQSFYEITRTFASYMNIFDNSAFNQDVESMCMEYIQKLMTFYPDKRSREYQDVKKFVNSFFVEWELMTEKEVMEFFKIKRKKKDE